MQLLVSVRSADEVEPAVAGGAEIIDAKEPANGALGALSPATLVQVALRVPRNQQLSVALGDVTSVEQVIALVDQLELPARTAPTYVKLGFAGVRSAKTMHELLSTAVQRAALHSSRLSIIAVAYADAARVPALPAEVVVQVATDAGARGVLMDTHLKDAIRLLDWLPPESLADWVSVARASGLLAGVAGALKPDDVAAVAVAHPDVIGFRGAACESGRLSRISRDRVAMLRRCIDAATRTPPAILPISPRVGETRGSTENLSLGGSGKSF
jgi:(5-formylfuran-3-yl)methyl phosphate synthase